MSEKVKKPLKKGVNKFEFVGEVKINDYTFSIDVQSSKSDWVYNTLNLGVKCNETMGYSQIMAGYGSERDNVLKVHGKDKDGKDDFKKKFKIAWEDRFDEDILETIGRMKFTTVGLEKDDKDKLIIKKFLSGYDAVEYIKEHLKDGDLVRVKGNIVHSIYNDKTQQKREISSIYLITPQKDKEGNDIPVEQSATFEQTILVDKESVFFDKERNTWVVNARVLDYMKEWNGREIKNKQERTQPYNVQFDLSISNATPEQIENMAKKYFTPKKGWTELRVKGDIFEGEVTKEVTEDDITDEFKEHIACGLMTKEEVLGQMASTGAKDKRLIIRGVVFYKDKNDKMVLAYTPDSYVDEDFIFDFMSEVNEDSETVIADDSQMSDDELAIIGMASDVSEEEMDFLKDM
jgi:hypothetical protein